MDNQIMTKSGKHCGNFSFSHNCFLFFALVIISFIDIFHGFVKIISKLSAAGLLYHMGKSFNERVTIIRYPTKSYDPSTLCTVPLRF